VLPTGQVVGDAADGVVPTKDVATPTPETAARTKTNDMVIVRSRYLDECMSFIRRTGNDLELRVAIKQHTKLQLLRDYSVQQRR